MDEFHSDWQNSPEAEPDLLECPFCGSEAGFGRHGWDRYFVNCTDCLAATSHLTVNDDYVTKAEAAAAWNRRVLVPKG